MLVPGPPEPALYHSHTFLTSYYVYLFSAHLASTRQRGPYLIQLCNFGDRYNAQLSKHGLNERGDVVERCSPPDRSSEAEKKAYCQTDQQKCNRGGDVLG